MSYVTSGLSDLLPRMSSVATALSDQIVREDHVSAAGIDDANSRSRNAELRTLINALNRAIGEVRKLDYRPKTDAEYAGLLNTSLSDFLFLCDKLQELIESLSTTEESRALISQLVHAMEELRWDVSIELANILPVDPNAKVLTTSLQVRDWIESIDQRD